MVFIGMDHGTTGISFCIMSDEAKIIDIFKIGREESKRGEVSALEEISKRCNLEEIKLMAITYAMGDGINKILPIYFDIFCGQCYTIHRQNDTVFAVVYDDY